MAGSTFNGRVRIGLLLSLACSGLIAPIPGHAQDATPPAAQDSRKATAQELAGAVTNPNVPLTQLQLRDVLAPGLPGFQGAGNTLQLQAVIPLLPSSFIPFPIITKLTIPLTSLPPPVDQTALGNIQFFAQAVFAHGWGSWGVGASFVFPTQTFSGSGVPPATWQIGPAAAIILTAIPNLVFGGVFQNPFALSTQNPGTALIFTPSITYTLPEGWFAGWSDYNWSADWEQGGALTLSVGLQVGKVLQILGHPFSFSLEGGYNVLRPSNGAGVPYWMFGAEFTAILPAL